MPRAIASPFAAATIGAVLTALSLFVLPWSRYGDIEIPLTRFTGWPVYAVSALALQAIVAWALFLPARWPRARLAAGIVCAVTAVASAIVLGFRYDNAPDFFEDVMPLVIPTPGKGPMVAVLAALASAAGLVPARRV